MLCQLSRNVGCCFDWLAVKMCKFVDFSDQICPDAMVGAQRHHGRHVRTLHQDFSETGVQRAPEDQSQLTRQYCDQDI
jgi:hypothetical protein